MTLADQFRPDRPAALAPPRRLAARLGPHRLAGWLDRAFPALAMLSFLAGLGHHLAELLRSGQLATLDWKITQYHLGYGDAGFAKRAVVGTLLDPVLALLEDGGLGERALVIALDAALCLGLALVVARTLRGLGPDWAGWRWRVQAMLVLSPLGFQQWGYDVGRYDHPNLLLLTGVAALALRGRGLAAGALLAFAILVHEAVFFWGTPVLVLVLLARRARWRAVAVALVVPVAALAGVAQFGNLDPAALEAALGNVGTGGEVWSRGVLEPPREALGTLNHAILAGYLGAVALLLAGIRVHAVPGLAVLAVAALPLCLFALGIDWFRWVGLGFAMVLVLVTALAAGGLASPRRGRLPWLLATAALLLPLGPIGITTGLPYVSAHLDRFIVFAGL